MSYPDIAVLFVYFGGMTLFGLYFARKNKSTEEYFLGNRAFAGWVIGMSMIGTSISSISFLAIPADAFKNSWFRMLPGCTLPIAVLAGAYLFMPFYRRTRTTSAFEYLEARFGTTARMYGAFAFLVGQLFRISTILFLLSVVVHQLTGLNLYASIVIGGVFVSFYTVAGGIEAVVWTDVVQTIILLVGGIVVLAVIVMRLPGGLQQILHVGAEHHKFALANMVNGELEPTSWAFVFNKKTALMILLVGLTGQMMEHACDQNLVQRYCAAKSMREARKALLMCCCASIPIWAYFYFVGTSLYVFYLEYPHDGAQEILQGLNGTKAENILPFFVMRELPVGISGIVLAAVAAAAMSSLDSSINAISTVSIVDMYRRHFVKGRDDRHYLVVARLIAVGASVFMILGAMLYASFETNTLSDTTTALTAIVSGGLLGLYLLGFLTKRGDGRTITVAIGFTVAWSLYKTLERYDKLPESLLLPWNTDDYYTGIFSHLIMFGIGFLVGSLFGRRDRDLTNLTVWTMDKTPIT